jgi:hypothetical protein
MPKLIFRAALIRFVDLRYDEKSKAKYVKINFTASFSEPVREAMEWGEPPAGFASAKLDGDLTASHIILTPDGKELSQHELQMDISGASGFEVHRVKVGEDSHENELRFQVVTSAPGAAARLEAYLEVIGKGTAQLRVNYEQQQPLVTTDTQERLISEEQAHDTSEATDDTAADDPGAPLAQAATMGGTHQRKVRTPRADRGTVN